MCKTSVRGGKSPYVGVVGSCGESCGSHWPLPHTNPMGKRGGGVSVQGECARAGLEGDMGKGWLWWWRHVAKSEPLARLGCTNGRAGRGECATGVCKSEHAESECVRRPAMDGSGSHQPLPHSAPHGWGLKPNGEEEWQGECARVSVQDECARQQAMLMWMGGGPISRSLTVHPTGGGSNPMGKRGGRLSVQDECARASVQGHMRWPCGQEQLPLAALSHHTHGWWLKPIREQGWEGECAR